MTPLPAFVRDETSPPIAGPGSGIALALDGDGLMSQVVAHGSYRLTAEDRTRLGPGRIRHQVWLLAVNRKTRATYWTAPARESVVFAEEEPEKGPVEGWFHVRLAAGSGIPGSVPGLYDITAILGPFLSKPVGLTLRAG